jgi:hypothetical protein
VRRFAPTRICELRDVVLSHGDLYRGPFKRMVFGGPRRLAVPVEDEIDDAGVLCTTWLGWRYFGHWLNEDYADAVHTRDLAPASEIEQAETPHRAAYRALFGIARRTVPATCRIGRVTLVQTDLGSRFRVEAWQQLTDRIEALHPPLPHPGCMLLRGASGQKRMLVNEAEVADFLRRRGFRIVAPEQLALDDLLAELSGSRLIVGVEGSQLAHGFHCLRAPGAMVVLQPPDRFGLSDKDRCDRKGLRYAFTIGVPDGDGFRIELASLARILEMTIDAIDRDAAAH